MPTKAPKEGTVGTYKYEGDKETFVPEGQEDEPQDEEK